MKALAIDCASSKMTVEAENEGANAVLSIDTGARQSQQLLPAIDFALKTAGLKIADLEFSALTLGPGTFTGLRIAFSALKAIELADGVPIFGIPTLYSYAFPFEKDANFVIPVITAKKNQFFASIFFGEEEKLSGLDSTAEEIASILENLKKTQKIDESKKFALVVGENPQKIADLINEKSPNLNVEVARFQPPATKSLLKIAESWKAQNKAPLKDYDGPLYMRKSEAEIVLDSKSM